MAQNYQISKYIFIGILCAKIYSVCIDPKTEYLTSHNVDGMVKMQRNRSDAAKVPINTFLAVLCYVRKFSLKTPVPKKLQSVSWI